MQDWISRIQQSKLIDFFFLRREDYSGLKVLQKLFLRDKQPYPGRLHVYHEYHRAISTFLSTFHLYKSANIKPGKRILQYFSSNINSFKKVKSSTKWLTKPKVSFKGKKIAISKKKLDYQNFSQSSCHYHFCDV